MTYKEMLGNAEWIGTGCDLDIPLIRDSFTAGAGEKAEITVIGFGVFILYINGKRVHETECLPLVSNFGHRNFPLGEIMENRIYPERFDISHLLVEGENVISVLLGNGWFNRPIWEESFGYGNKRVAYRIVFGDGREHLSGTSAGWVPSPVTDNHYNKGEEQDLRISMSEAMLPGFSGKLLPTVTEKCPDCENFQLSDCPRDVVHRALDPKLYKSEGDSKIYDFGINTTGYPIVKAKGAPGQQVKIYFSEALTKDGSDIDMTHHHSQVFHLTLSGGEDTARPYFGWICARYARVEGPAQIVAFEETYSDLEANVDFECDNNVLNYLFRVFLHTQLINMHTGIPSDCPHLERRGYTGDGQLACHAAMMMTDSESFYRKWLIDISDCQDRVSGHVQYTAPYTHSGGGPGGWGSAMVTVPYEFYLRFGDDKPMRDMYSQMHEYIGYLDTHSDGYLVNRDREGEWCLGDWCTPDPVILPAPFVNNYFYVKCCEKMIEIARIIGKEEDISGLKEKIRERRLATRLAYKNPWDGNFLGGVQGANAFALDMGIGTYRTKANFIERYEKLGYYDTGIFGTDLVTRLLFEYGRGDIAVRLMSASEPHGYGRFMREDRSTLPEYWGDTSRSLCHPMFGASAAYLFDYVLGIRREEGSVGYREVVINPRALDSVKSARGYLYNADGGRISVSYTSADRLTLDIEIPESTKARLLIGEKEYPLAQGENHIEI